MKIVYLLLTLALVCKSNAWLGIFEDEDESDEEIVTEVPPPQATTGEISSHEETEDEPDEREDSEEAIIENLIKSGFKTRITQKGLNYARDVALSMFSEKIGEIQMPEIVEDVGPGRVKVTNVRVVEFPQPLGSIMPIPGYGIRWHTYGISPTFTADYSAKIKIGFFSIYKHGTVTFEAEKLSFTLDFFVGRNPVDRRPYVSVLNCQADGDVWVTFTGGWSDALNLGSRIFRSKIRDIMMDQMCAQATGEINVNAELAMEHMNVQEQVHDGFVLDFGLTQAPRFTDDAIASYHKGTVYYEGNPVEPPFDPPSIPEFPEHDDHMAYIYITSYMINTGFYAAFANDKMMFNVTSDMIPEDARKYLRTRCPLSLCIGTGFPQIHELYPDTQLAVNIRASGSPKVFLGGKDVTLKGWVELDLLAVTNTETHFLLSLSGNITSVFEIQFSAKQIKFNVTSITPSAAITESGIGDIGMNFFFDTILSMATDRFLKPELNKIGNAGFTPPDMPDVEFVNSRVVVQDSTEDVLVVATDLIYIPPTDNSTEPIFG